MHHRRRHVVVDDRHLDVLDHQLLVLQLQKDHLNDTDLMMLNHLKYVVGNFRFQHLLDVVNLDGLQILGELNPDVALTVPDAVHQLHQLVAVVGVELRHQLRMDYFQVVVDEEQHHLKRMDYFQDAQLA